MNTTGTSKVGKEIAKNLAKRALHDFGHNERNIARQLAAAQAVRGALQCWKNQSDCGDGLSGFQQIARACAVQTDCQHVSECSIDLELLCWSHRNPEWCDLSFLKN